MTFGSISERDYFIADGIHGHLTVYVKEQSLAIPTGRLEADNEGTYLMLDLEEGEGVALGKEFPCSPVPLGITICIDC